MPDLQIVRTDLLEDDDRRHSILLSATIVRGILAAFGIPTSSPWRPDPATADPNWVRFDLRHPDDADVQADEERMAILTPLTDFEALEAVQAEVELIRPVRSHPVDEAVVPAVLSVMWAELAVALVRARQPSAALRASEVAYSFVPVEYYDHFLVSNVLRAVALAEIYTGDLGKADELLFEASETDQTWNLPHQLLIAAHIWAEGDHESADRYLETIVRRVERQRYEGVEQIRDRVRLLRSA